MGKKGDKKKLDKLKITVRAELILNKDQMHELITAILSEAPSPLAKKVTAF